MALAERLDAAHREKGPGACLGARVRPSRSRRGRQAVHRRRRQAGGGRDCAPSVRRARAEALSHRGAGADGEPRQDQRQFPHRFGDRGLERGNRAREQGGDRSARASSTSSPTRCSARRSTRPMARSSPRSAFSPAGFKAELGNKDVRLALSAAQELKVPMPLASLIADRFLALIASGGAELWTGRRSRSSPSATPAMRRRLSRPSEPAWCSPASSVSQHSQSQQGLPALPAPRRLPQRE